MPEKLQKPTEKAMEKSNGKSAEKTATLAEAVTTRRAMFMLLPLLVLVGGASFVVSFFLFRPDPVGPVASPTVPMPVSRLGDLPADRDAYQEKIADVEVNFDELAREQNARKASLDQKELQLRLQESRLAEEAARLKQEIAALESVQMQTLEALRKVNEAKIALDQNRVVIAREERTNLKHLVAKYNAMTTSQAGEIFHRMCSNGSEDVVVRILYTMNERSAAKILADMPDKSTSARLTELLLRVRDQQNAT